MPSTPAVLFQPLLSGVVNDEVVHIFSEQLAGHGDGNRRVHLVTGEHPHLTWSMDEHSTAWHHLSRIDSAQARVPLPVGALVAPKSSGT